MYLRRGVGARAQGAAYLRDTPDSPLPAPRARAPDPPFDI